MALLFSTAMINTGGRSGEVHSPDKSFSHKITPPDAGMKDATNPEQLFAAGYSACFGSALSSIMLRDGIKAPYTITVVVSLYKEEKHNYFLGVEIDGHIEGLTIEQAEMFLQKAHAMCPYSKAIKGNVDVQIKAV